ASTVPNPGGAYVERWPYSSSYMPPSGAYDRSRIGFRTYQSPTGHRWYITPNASMSAFGGTKLGDVASPAQKVHLYGGNERHFNKRKPFFAMKNCRQPLLMFDVSVAVRSNL